MIRHGLAVAAALVGMALAGAPQAATAPGDSPFDLSDPAVYRLDPALLAAVQAAARAAANDGVTVGLTSGWRSPEFQRQLFEDAVVQYGSIAIARQYVMPPEVSKHVLGKAVDLGPGAADDWLIRNGQRFGLCQIYANEAWHFELATDYGGTCPPLRPNAAG
jgi:zinc D-Ala-D-Ala carboxypeptidase